MSATINRRLAALEARTPVKPQVAVRVMPWDVLPPEESGTLLVKRVVIMPRPDGGTDIVPYERNGVHPSEDDPGSVNAMLHRQIGGSA